jgi:hypothetical protein
MPLWGAVNGGQSFTVENIPAAGYTFLWLGLDAYPTVQPNNGDFVFEATGSGPGGGTTVLYQVQQSQNFPGPFSWRGMVPIYPGYASLDVTATVGFNFIIWGLMLPSIDQDSTMGLV